MWFQFFSITQGLLYGPGTDLGICSMGTWKKCVFFYCWMECSIHVEQIFLVNSAVSFYTFANFLFNCSIDHWVRGDVSPIIMDLSTFFISIKFFALHFANLLFSANVFRIAMSSCLISIFIFIECPYLFLVFFFSFLLWYLLFLILILTFFSFY